MAIQTEPTRIQIPFADSGTKNVIPDTNSTPSASQAASWTDGFPAQCSLPLSAGGIPPARADFNGLFNTMTQSLRYGQEGGVWAWDATVDYGTNRVVLGSDGLLYWSVAQSGPNVGGAQDPTADTSHTYWTSPKAASMPLGDKSKALATTEWVKTLGVAAIYLDPAGSDSNDGMSAANAVQTFARAKDIAKTFSQTNIHLVATGGTYSGDFDFSNGESVFLEITGDVTISGKFIAGFSTSILIVGLSHAFTVTSGASGYVARLGGGSFVYIRCANCTFQATGSATYVLSAYSSNLYIDSDVSIDATSSNVVVDALGVKHGSFVDVSGSIVIQNKSYKRAILVSLSSTLTCDTLNIINTNSYGTSETVCITQNSFVYIETSTTITSNTSVSNNVLVERGSGLLCGGTSSFRINNQNGHNIRLQYDSVFSASGTSISFDCSTKCIAALVIDSSTVVISPGTLASAGQFTYAFIACLYNSVFSLGSSTAITNNSTGPRYFGSFNSTIFVAGRGDILPGNAAGTVQTNAVYG